MRGVREVQRVFTVIVFATFLVSGCIAPGGLEDLKITIHLEDDTFDRIQDVSGTIEVKNIGDTKVVGYLRHCSGFKLQRMSDGMQSSVQCTIVADPPIWEHSFDPGESTWRSFSFASSSYKGAWEHRPEEFSSGRYGLTVSILWEGNSSDMVLFKTVEDA